MKTLSATDGSAYAVTAITSAARLLVRSGNEFDLICVVPDFDYPVREGRRSPGILKKVRSAYQERAASTFSIDDAAKTLVHVVEKPWLRLSWDKEWQPEFERSYAETAEQPEDERLFARETAARSGANCRRGSRSFLCAQSRC